ncbi:hypothetical protein RJ55_01319 [Drechmeria coniospora]|nr:hypothetical protein RJ55_01319 [Drechmeria coniospora]
MQSFVSPRLVDLKRPRDDDGGQGPEGRTSEGRTSEPCACTLLWVVLSRLGREVRYHFRHSRRLLAAVFGLLILLGSGQGRLPRSHIKTVKTAGGGENDKAWAGSIRGRKHRHGTASCCPVAVWLPSRGGVPASRRRFGCGGSSESPTTHHRAQQGAAIPCREIASDHACDPADFLTSSSQGAPRFETTQPRQIVLSESSLREHPVSETAKLDSTNEPSVTTAAGHSLDNCQLDSRRDASSFRARGNRGRTVSCSRSFGFSKARGCGAQR